MAIGGIAAKWGIRPPNLPYPWGTCLIHCYLQMASHSVQRLCRCTGVTETTKTVTDIHTDGQTTRGNICRNGRNRWCFQRRCLWWSKGDRLLVPAAVSGSVTGECGLLPQHFHHRINVRRCGHFAFTTISSACWLFAGGLKIIIISEKILQTTSNLSPIRGSCPWANIARSSPLPLWAIQPTGGISYTLCSTSTGAADVGRYLVDLESGLKPLDVVYTALKSDERMWNGILLARRLNDYDWQSGEAWPAYFRLDHSFVFINGKWMYVNGANVGSFNCSSVWKIDITIFFRFKQRLFAGRTATYAWTKRRTYKNWSTGRDGVWRVSIPFPTWRV